MLHSKFGSRIAPLYTKTRNWRGSLQEDSRVEFNVTSLIPLENLKFVPVVRFQLADVVEIDEVDKLIKLKMQRVDVVNELQQSLEPATLQNDEDRLSKEGK